MAGGGQTRRRASSGFGTNACASGAFPLIRILEVSAGPGSTTRSVPVVRHCDGRVFGVASIVKC